MRTDLSIPIQAVETARATFVAEASNLSYQQAEFQPAADSWSIKEVVEHIYWAEKVGVLGMWKALTAYKNGTPLWQGENSNAGLSIEEVVANTWQVKEIVPPIAAPKWGGPIDFWLAGLAACTQELIALQKALEGLNPSEIIFPHPISGPLEVYQRINFLSFHMKRHQAQIQAIKTHSNYPKN